MKWIKKGHIFKADGQANWMASHTQNPFIAKLQDRLRIFFTTRPEPKDGLYKSVIAFIDIEKEDFTKVINISEQPVMELGKLGSFDEFGTMPGAIVKNGDELWMYYVGWMRSNPAPYSWSVGLAISKDEGVTFERYSEGPVLGRTHDDPYLQNGCTSVIIEDDTWHMFYSSGKKWFQTEGKPESLYLIRHAVSKDGINWIRDKDFCLDMKFKDESQTSPTIFKLDNVYHMLFPYRHSLDFRNKARSYRIGYAYSKDLVNWTRDDSKVGIDISEKGWDSEMVCYPHVVKIEDKYYMFYCGNGFGKSGFGYAELDL